VSLLVIQGEDWSFLAATQFSKVDGSVAGAGAGDSSLYTTMIWNKVFVGSTTFLEGVWEYSRGDSVKNLSLCFHMVCSWS